MSKKEVLRDTELKEVAEVKPDAKNRITLGKVSVKAHCYKVYQNSLGQIVLDPQVTVPAHEAWLFQNKTAGSMVRRGLEDAKSGRIMKAKEDYSKYIE